MIDAGNRGTLRGRLSIKRGISGGLSIPKGRDPGKEYERLANKVTEITDESTDIQYPSAKAVYDLAKNNERSYERLANKVTEITDESTDIQYPSAAAVRNYVQDNSGGKVATPEKFEAVDANGRIIIDKFREMIEYGADNGLPIHFTQDYTFEFAPDTVPRTIAKNGVYIYDNPNPTAIEIVGKNNIHIDGCGHTVYMTGLTRTEQEKFRYSDIGGLAEFFTFLKFNGCENVTVENMNIVGDYLYDANGEKAGETETIPAEEMAPVNPARIPDISGYSDEDYTYLKYHLGYFTARAVGIKFGGASKHCLAQNIRGKGIFGNLINVIGSNTFDIIIDNCVASSMLENCFNNMGGPYTVKYSNCTMYDSLQGIETGNASSSGQTDFDFYGNDGPAEYTTIVSSCYFRRVKLGLVMEGMDICSDSAFYESTAKLNGCARGTFSGCVFRLDRYCEILSGAKAIFEGCQFRYPRLDALIYSSSGSNKSASIWFDWNSYSTDSEGYRTIKPYYIYAYKAAGKPKGPNLSFDGCQFHMDYPSEMNGHSLRYKNTVTNEWVDVTFTPRLYFSESEVAFTDCQFFSTEDNKVVVVDPAKEPFVEDCRGLYLYPEPTEMSDSEKVNLLWDKYSAFNEQVYTVSQNDWIANKFIYAASGAEGGNSTNKASVKITIPSNAVSLRYTQLITTAQSAVAGIAFYNGLGDEIELSKRYISGVGMLTGQSDVGGRIDEVEIPEHARYVRFTYVKNQRDQNNVKIYPDFYCGFIIREPFGALSGITPERFGYDGSGDCTEAMQACLDSEASSIVRLQKGTYEMSNLQLKHDTTIIIENGAKILQKAAVGANEALFRRSAYSLTIEGGEIDFNREANAELRPSGILVELPHGKTVNIHNCVFHGVTSGVLNISNFGGTLLFNENYIYDVAAGTADRMCATLLHMGGGEADHPGRVVIHNNVCYSTDYEDPEIRDSLITLPGGFFLACSYSGNHDGNRSTVEFTGNFMHGFGMWQADVNKEKAIEAWVDRGADDNDPLKPNEKTGEIAIFVKSSFHTYPLWGKVVVRDNVIEAFNQNAIDVKDSANVLITGNVCRNGIALKPYPYVFLKKKDGNLKYYSYKNVPYYGTISCVPNNHISKSGVDEGVVVTPINMPNIMITDNIIDGAATIIDPYDDELLKFFGIGVLGVDGSDSEDIPDGTESDKLVSMKNFVNGVLIEGNMIRNCGAQGIYVACAKNSEIRNNQLIDISGGIFAKYCEGYLLIEGNTISSTYNYSLWYSDDKMTFDTLDLIIVNNIFRNYSTNPERQYVMRVREAKNMSISGNTFYYNAMYMIIDNNNSISGEKKFSHTGNSFVFAGSSSYGSQPYFTAAKLTRYTLSGEFAVKKSDGIDLPGALLSKTAGTKLTVYEDDKVYISSRYINGQTAWIDNNALTAEIGPSAVASFPDGAALPVKDITIGIEPVQDLHGYDAPWPAGGGKNKCLPYTERASHNGIDYTVTENGIKVKGTSSASSYSWVSAYASYSASLIKLPAGTYTFSSSAIPTDSQNTSYLVFMGFTESGTAITDIVIAGTMLSKTATFSELVGIYYGFYVASGQSVDCDCKIMIESGSSKTNFAPYSNICPISGFESAKVRRTGKNLISPKYSSRTYNGITFTVNSDGTITTSNTATNDAYAAENLTANLSMMTLIPPGTYTLTGGISSDELVYIAGKYADGSKIPSAGYTSDSGSGRAFTLTKYAYVYPQIKIKSGTTSNRTFKIQLELGSTATTYEPYIGNTYDISWETKAGTVYGGTLDVTTGVLTVDKAIVSVADLSWTYNGTWDYMQTLALQSTILRPASNTDVLSGLLCSAYKSGTAQQTGSGAVNGTVAVDTSGVLRIRDEAYTDADIWKTAMGAQIIVYPIAASQTYQLTGVQIFTLLGYNNIWADTGDISVAYKADTKAYIEKRIREILAEQG